MKKVVYFGMGFLPDENAVANREVILAEMIRKVGYSPILIGVNRNLKYGQFSKQFYNGIECYDVMYPETILEKTIDNFIFSKTIINIFKEIGVSDICCFIMQDYQLGPMKSLLAYCKRNGIKFVPDIMDWFTATSDSSTVKNLIKSVDTHFRMNYFYPKLEYRLCISHKFERYFSGCKGKNYTIPCTSFTESGNGSIKKERTKTLVFAGNPGKKLEKEKLDWVIRALYENNSRMILKIIGIDYDECIKNNPELSEFITSRIIFLGKMSHDECTSILRNSDFSIVIRKSNKLSEYGFSSKICESFSYGIPVLATNVSDNALYIKNCETGYICDSNYLSVKEMLSNIENLDADTVYMMKSNLIKSNPLSHEHFIDVMRLLIEE